MKLRNAKTPQQKNHNNINCGTQITLQSHVLKVIARFELLVVVAIFMRFQQLFIGVKIAVVQLCGRSSVYRPFGVSENVTV